MEPGTKPYPTAHCRWSSHHLTLYMCVVCPQPLVNFHESCLKPVLSSPEKYRFQYHEAIDDKNNATTPLCLKGTEPSTLSDWQS